MSSRALLLGVLAVAAALLVAGGATRTSAAAFTASVDAGGNGFTVDALRNHFAVAPGPYARGDVDSLSVDLGLVVAPGAVTGVFTVTNVTGQARTATVAVLGPDQVASAAFETSGAASATLGPGDSTDVSVTTSPTVAGRGSGTLRLGLGGSTWLYRDYTLALDAAPVAPTSLTATPGPAGHVGLAWDASATTENLAGYHVYRSTGGPWTRLTPDPVAATSYADTATADGTLYSYAVRAVSSGPPALESVASPEASARAGAAPPAPSAVELADGAGQGGQWINGATAGSVSVSVTLPATSQASDTVSVTLTSGGRSATASAPAPAGAGTVTLTGIDASALPDGTVTISATAADAAGNVSTTRSTTAPKDTVAPAAPSASYVDERNAADQIVGTAEANAAVTAVQTVPSASGPYTAVAGGAGAYTATVAATKGSPGKPVTVVYLVTAADAAGNTSAATTLTYGVIR